MLGAALVAAPLAPAVEPLERSGFDFRLGLRPSGGWPSDLVLVPIDDGAMQAHGRWPWPREKTAALLDALTAAGVKTTVVDLIFHGASTPESDAALEGALANAVIGVSGSFEATQPPPNDDFRAALLPADPLPNITWDTRTFIVPERRFVRAAAAIGHTLSFLPEDRVVRGHFPLLGMPGERGTLPSLALAGLRHQRGWEATEIRYDGSGNLRLPSGTLPLRNGESYLDWIPGEEELLSKVRAADLLAGRSDPALLEGAMALVYIDSKSTGDVAVVPGGSAPGGIVLATAIRTLDGRHVPSIAPTWSVLAALLLLLVAASSLLARIPARILIALAFTLPLLFFAVACALVSAADFFVPVASPAALLLATCAALAFRSDRLAERERRRLKSLLSQAQALLGPASVETGPTALETRPTSVLPARPSESSLGQLAAGAPLAQPVAIGHYKVTRCLGRGGMGAIFLAEDTKLDRLVALKVLTEQDPTAFERFRREALAVARIDHPNVVRIFEIGFDADVPFLAIEYVAGGSVVDWFRAYPSDKPWPPPWTRSIGIVRGAAAGLGAAHAAGMVHRDVKPANILLTPEGHAKIADFGIAKLGGSKTLTREGSMIGTIGYLSPEQALGQEVDPRSDVYSLGVTWYRLLTARAPFDGTTAEVLRRQVMNSLPDPRLIVRDLPAAVAELVMRMTNVERPVRPENGAEVAREIDRLLANAETRGTA